LGIRGFNAAVINKERFFKVEDEVKRLSTRVMILLMLFAPLAAAAQIPPEFAETAPPTVGILPFAGDELDMNIQLYDAVIEELERVGKYQPVYLTYPEGQEPEFMDIPPSISIPSDMQYTVTGELFWDDESFEYHFQMWLWDMGRPILIYTDELVYEEFFETADTLPGMIEWIFSHIVVEELAAEEPAAMAEAEESGDEEAEEAEEELYEEIEIPDSDAWKYKRLYLGLRGGLSSRFYKTPWVDPYVANDTQRFTFEAGMQIAVSLADFFDIQAELLFTRDTVPFRGFDHQYDPVTDGTNLVEFSETFESLSLMIPLLLKFSFKPGPFLVAPFGGAYFTLPLGKMNGSGGAPAFDTIPASKRGAYDASLNLPVGFTVGFSFGVKLGPGLLFTDIRYSQDIGATNIDASNGVRSYNRNMASFTLGYLIGFIDRKRPVVRRIIQPDEIVEVEASEIQTSEGEPN
jgi:hypothetical protein